MAKFKALKESGNLNVEPPKAPSIPIKRATKAPKGEQGSLF
jgi:hypothetical protein